MSRRNAALSLAGAVALATASCGGALGERHSSRKRRACRHSPRKACGNVDDWLLITAVLVGRHALLEHIGLGIADGKQGSKLRTAAESVPWEAVLRLTSGKVVVRNGKEARR